MESVDWVSPYHRERVAELVEEAAPPAASNSWFSRMVWQLLAWGGRQVEPITDALPIPMPKEVLKKAARDYRAVRLAQDIARNLLLADLEVSPPDLRITGMRSHCEELFGDASLLGDVDYPQLLNLVGSEMANVARREPRLRRLVAVRQIDLVEPAAPALVENVGPADEEPADPTEEPGSAPELAEATGWLTPAPEPPIMRFVGDGWVYASAASAAASDAPASTGTPETG